LLLVGRGDDAPPADEEGFLAYAQKLSTPTIYNAMKGAKPLSKLERYSFPESKWRHFGRLDHFPRGLLPVGDAICCLNPVYGQGITVAVQETNILRRLLPANAVKVDPLATLAPEFLAQAEALIKQPWAISAIPDFIYPQTRGERPEDLEYRLKLQLALGRIATRDPSVHKLVSEVRHLLKPLEALDEPALVRRMEAENEDIVKDICRSRTSARQQLHLIIVGYQFGSPSKTVLTAAWERPTRSFGAPADSGYERKSISCTRTTSISSAPIRKLVKHPRAPPSPPFRSPQRAAAKTTPALTTACALSCLNATIRFTTPGVVG
jgi:hypothetical protein